MHHDSIRSAGAHDLPGICAKAGVHQFAVPVCEYGHALYTLDTLDRQRGTCRAMHYDHMVVVAVVDHVDLLDPFAVRRKPALARVKIRSKQHEMVVGDILDVIAGQTDKISTRIFFALDFEFFKIRLAQLLEIFREDNCIVTGLFCGLRPFLYASCSITEFAVRANQGLEKFNVSRNKGI